LGQCNKTSMEKPLVSIIVPIYKVEIYLKQCIDSLVGQTLKNIEIILVNDGSPDNCPAICDAYAKKDPRINVIHQKNAGYGRACNVGINSAEGEYIGIVESDDYIEFDMFETLYSISKTTHSPIIKGSFFHEYQDNTNRVCSLGHITKNQKICTVRAKDSLSLMLYESSIWSAIYNRDFIVANKIQMFETKGASYQDVVWKFVTYAAAESITLIDKPVYHYRVLTQHSSSKSSKNYDAMFINYAEIKRSLDSTENFEQFCESYYLHQFFDAAFHLGRLDKQGRKKFIEKMRRMIEDAKQEGITIDSFSGFHVPLYVRETYYQIVPNKIPFKIRMFNLLKQACFVFYQAQIGKFVWKCIKKTTNSKYIRKLLLKSLEYNNIVNTENSPVILNQIHFHAKRKNVLVIMPFWGKSAACLYANAMCEILHRSGYALHLVVYSCDGTVPSDSLWDHAYAVQSNLPNYGNPYIFGRDTSKFDTNLIDDWVGDDLMDFIKILDKNCHFDLCLCNYVFLSKTLTYFNNSIKKILVTHDIFSDRNKRMHEVGIDSFYFGTVPEEEKKGLERADCIIAIQEKERMFFKTITDKPIITLPYIPSKKYQTYQFSEAHLRVGYIASHHGPNILSITEYIKLLKNEKEIEIFIAGPISCAIDPTLKNVHILGIIDNLEEFYSRYDIYPNPDLMESGLKIKTVEAFSYGRPVICTKAASAGIEVVKGYHQCRSIVEIAELTKKCVKNTKLLSEMAEESKRVYDTFYSVYSAHEIMEKVINNV